MCGAHLCEWVHSHMCAYMCDIKLTSSVFLNHLVPSLLRQVLLLDMVLTNSSYPAAILPWLLCKFLEFQTLVLIFVGKVFYALSHLPSPQDKVLRHSGHFSPVEMLEGMMPQFCRRPGLVP